MVLLRARPTRLRARACPACAKITPSSYYTSRRQQRPPVPTTMCAPGSRACRPESRHPHCRGKAWQQDGPRQCVCCASSPGIWLAATAEVYGSNRTSADAHPAFAEPLSLTGMVNEPASGVAANLKSAQRVEEPSARRRELDRSSLALLHSALRLPACPARRRGGGAWSPTAMRRSSSLVQAHRAASQQLAAEPAHARVHVEQNGDQRGAHRRLRQVLRAPLSDRCPQAFICAALRRSARRVHGRCTLELAACAWMAQPAAAASQQTSVRDSTRWWRGGVPRRSKNRCRAMHSTRRGNAITILCATDEFEPRLTIACALPAAHQAHAST